MFDHNLKPIPEHGPCFICGSQNPKSIGVKWFYDEENNIHCKTILTKEQQGPPDHAHGGSTAALLDEAMGFAAWILGHKIVSVNLNINFLKPVPLNIPIYVKANVTKISGRKIFAHGEIKFENGEIAVEGTSILIEPNGFFSTDDIDYQNFLKNK